MVPGAPAGRICLTTGRAFVRLAPRVRELMGSEVATTGECFATQSTRVRADRTLHVPVDPAFMLLHATLLVESLATHPTQERFLPRVGSLVHNQPIVLTKTFATVLTNVRFLTRMDTAVDRQLCPLCERPVANCTLEWLLTQVDPLVAFQVGLEVEGLATSCTLKGTFNLVMPDGDMLP